METIPGDRGGRDPNQIPELAIVLALVSGVAGSCSPAGGRGHKNRGTSRKILKTFFHLSFLNLSLLKDRYENIVQILI